MAKISKTGFLKIKVRANGVQSEAAELDICK
jgi:hypothetical protein